MEQRPAKEYLASGESGNVKVGDTLIITKADDPNAIGLFMRAGDGGTVVGYRAPNQDIEWTQAETSLINVPDTSTPVDIITLDMSVQHPDTEITTEDGTFNFYCRIENTERFTANVKVEIFVGSTSYGFENLEIAGDDTNFPAPFWSQISSDIPQNSIVKIQISSDRAINVRGDQVDTTLKLIKARAAPVTAMATAEKALVFDDSIGRRPKLSDITGALGASGQENMVEANFTALGTNESQTRYWQVFYDHIHDAFFTHELFKAV